ncbi:MAG: OB-fold nucleic acid binding domain-containing protein, partial [Acetobacteraceae bacterium]
RSLGLDRRGAGGAIRGLSGPPLPLFAAAGGHAPDSIEPDVALPPMTDAREVVEDYQSTGLSLRRHPAAFFRDDFARTGMIACADLMGARDGQRVTVPGIVLVRQRPGSARGVLFVTIEDETGIANLIIWPNLFERQRRLILTAGMIACRGRVQREGIVIHVVAEALIDLSDRLRTLGRIAPESFHIPGEDMLPGNNLSKRVAHGVKVPTRDFR